MAIPADLDWLRAAPRLTGREGWISFISERAARYLYATGHAQRFEARGANGLARQFLERLGRKGADHLLLARLLYLTQPRVRDFFERDLSQLTRSATRVSTGFVEVSHRGARGTILWPRTLQIRSGARASSGSFVVRRVEKSSDVPENRLLKLYLEAVAATVTATADIIGTGAVPALLERMRRRAQRALKEPYMREVGTGERVTALMKQRARRHRNWRYGQLLRLADELGAAVRQRKWEAILRLLERGWLTPVKDDDLFELYTLVLVMDVLEQEARFGPPVTYGLIRAGRESVAHFRRDSDGAEVEVYFDQSPAEIFALRSRYKNVTRSYEGVTGQEHRPDISLRVRLAGREFRLLLEAKKTGDEYYKRDSVYKMFGYLYDFEELWDMVRDQSPKAVLVFPEGVTPKPEGSISGDLVLLSASDRPRLAALLGMVCSA